MRNTILRHDEHIELVQVLLGVRCTAGQEILKDAVGLVLNDDGQTISLK